ncbi:DeoR/GlpR transcriptional regulator [Olsenella uli]|nr:DeoR/GlpR transcriptional regulator [Olsenella uli]
MLAEERLARIVEMVGRRGTASVSDLASELGISESTIRRDLDKLDQAHRLVKVHGGATTLESAHLTRDLTLDERHGLHAEEKRAICAYAATLVGPDDLVYLDAGSTVEELIGHLGEHRARYVTDSVSHAMKLAGRGFHVTVLGGELKSATESLIGPDTIAALSRYHFTIGFWGANGITPESGFTSPESNEALIKQLSMEHTARRYVLADATKFDSTSLVGFGPFLSATIVTCGDVPERYREFENVVEVSL